MESNIKNALVITINTGVARNVIAEMRPVMMELAMTAGDINGAKKLQDYDAEQLGFKSNTEFAHWSIESTGKEVSVIIDEKIVMSVVKLTVRYYKMVNAALALVNAAKGLFDMNSLKAEGKAFETMCNEKAAPAVKPEEQATE